MCRRALPAPAAAPWRSTATLSERDRLVPRPADEDAADLEAIVVGGADPAPAVHSTRVVGLDALPATPRLAHISRALAGDGAGIARRWGGCDPATMRWCWDCRQAWAA